MAKSNLKVFPQDVVAPDPVVVTTAVGSANTNAPTNTVQIGSAADADGEEIYSLTAIARATYAATVLHLFKSTDGGTTKKIVRSVLAPAATVGTSSAAPLIDFGFSEDDPLRLAGATTLFVGISVALADGFVFTREGVAY